MRKHFVIPGVIILSLTVGLFFAATGNQRAEFVIFNGTGGYRG